MLDELAVELRDEPTEKRTAPFEHLPRPLLILTHEGRVGRDVGEHDRGELFRVSVGVAGIGKRSGLHDLDVADLTFRAAAG